MKYLPPDRYHDTEYAIFECTGRTLHVFEGIVGLGLDGNGIYAGHDCEPIIVDEKHDFSDILNKEEMRELADWMIILWTEFLKQIDS